MTTAAIKRIRVLVVDDSAFMRRVLHGIISADPGMEVVGQASDGREAVKMAESLHPDVITMDLNMPHMDGLQATEHIMSMNPRPIVVVSSESRDGAASTLRALELGAVEFVAKPSSAIDLDMNSVREGLLRKLKMAAKVRVVRTATRTEFGTISPFSKNGSFPKRGARQRIPLPRRRLPQRPRVPTANRRRITGTRPPPRRPR
jgi:two-component system chemotaxis response regulator CheB